MNNAKSIVVYFSATGTTKGVAERLAGAIGADVFEIVPKEPYTPADLDWRDRKSRSSVEMADRASRPAVAGDAPDFSAYGTVYVGFPVWWNREPSIVDTFVERSAAALAGRTVVPFATSGGGGMGDSAANLQALAPKAEVVAGRRFPASVSAAALAEWARPYVRPAPSAVRFREIDVHREFPGNPFTWFTGRGLLLCAGDRESSNAMTIGWGGLGTLWGRDAVTVYVAERRHTKAFMDRSARFTVMAFDKAKQADVLDYMGRHSGRDGDKAAALGLHTAFTEAGTPYYEEAQLVLECELMYSAPFDTAGMKVVPAGLYANFPAGVHTMYIGRLVKALEKQSEPGASR